MVAARRKIGDAHYLRTKNNKEEKRNIKKIRGAPINKLLGKTYLI